MDTLTFIEGVIKAVAWPIATVIIALAFRAQITKLIPAIKRIKAGEFEAEFDRSFEKIREEITEAPTKSGLSTTDLLYRESILSLAEGSTRQALLATWARLEEEARNALRRKLEKTLEPGQLQSRPTKRKLAEALCNAKVLSPQEAEIFHEFQELTRSIERDESAAPSTQTTAKYLYSAAVLQRLLRRE